MLKVKCVISAAPKQNCNLFVSVAETNNIGSTNGMSLGRGGMTEQRRVSHHVGWILMNHSTFVLTNIPFIVIFVILFGAASAEITHFSFNIQLTKHEHVFMV